ncbi:MAG: hypothetical protein NG747_13365 [Candidatus Brocadia sp.]|nr:hypothetical protein [Candidatus Brocadia sp.]
MSQRVDLIINCVNNTNKAIQEATSSFQGMAAKISLLNYSIRSSYQTVKEGLDIVVLRIARLGEELLQMSQKTGMSVQELYALKNTAELSNISLGELSMVFSALSRNIFEARNRAGDARAIFDALGINTAKPLGQIINDLAKKFSALKDSEDKMAIALQIFGRSGSEIIPLLNDIASGAHGVSGVFSGEFAEASEKLGDNFTLLKQNVEKVSISIGGSLIPALNQLFDDIEKRRGALGILIEQFEDMWSVAKWAAKPLFDASKMAGDALDKLLGYNKAFAETQRLIKNSPTKASQLEFTFPMAKKDMPAIVTDEQRKKFVDNEENMADLVDKAGQQIIESLNKREQAYRDHARTIQAARESEIQLQLKEVDLMEQEFKLSRSDASQKRIEYYTELQKVQSEYLAGLDKEQDPASWYAQLNAINETREALVQLNLELKKQTGTFVEGAQYGFQQYMHDAKTAFEYGTEMAQSTAGAMEDFFANISFDAMQGKLKSLGDYFRSFLTSIQQMISEILSQLIVMGIMRAIAGGVGGAAGGATAGGSVAMVHSGGYIPRFHVGGLAPDEVPAILQRGEYVVSRRGVDMLDRINAGNVSVGNQEPVVIQQTIQFNTSAIDGRDTDRFFRENEGRIQAMVLKGIRNSRGFGRQMKDAK